MENEKTGPGGNHAPLISVIIPLYNHEKYIRETVDSVLNQTVSDFELIIINDGSTDGSEAVVEKIRDSRIQYYCQENRGAHETINKGINLAKGRYVSILNSDDLFMPDRLETAVNAIENQEEIQAVFSHLEIIDENGNTTGHARGPESNWEKDDTDYSFRGENSILVNLLAGNFLLTTSNLFCRKSLFDRIGYFRAFKYVHDYDFFLRLCYAHKVCVIDRPLVKYRKHEANTFGGNLPETQFEVGMLLSDFFLSHDLEKIFPDADVWPTLIRFFNSVQTFNADRMMMTLILFGLKHPKAGLPCDPGNGESKSLFKTVCLDYFDKRIGDWNESQEAWKRVSELGERIRQMDAMLVENHELLARQEARLIETHEEAKTSWLEAQNAWAKHAELGKQLGEELAEANDRLVATTRLLNETKVELTTKQNELDAKACELQEKENHLRLLTNSKSYRLGKAMTWPLRKIAGKN